MDIGDDMTFGKIRTTSGKGDIASNALGFASEVILNRNNARAAEKSSPEDAQRYKQHAEKKFKVGCKSLEASKPDDASLDEAAEKLRIALMIIESEKARRKEKSFGSSSIDNSK